MSGPTDHDCVLNGGAGGVGNAAGLTAIDDALLNGTLGSMGINAVRQWEQGMRFMGRMLRDPQIRANSAAADQYFIANDLQSMGRFARLFLMWERADSASANLIAQVNTMSQQVDSLVHLVDFADSLLISGSLSPAQLALWRQNRQSWAGQVGGLQAQVRTLDAQIIQNRLSRYQTVLTFNNGISVSAVHESNLKALNTALLHRAIDGVFSASDEVVLAYMAAQDPEVGGDAVSSALAALPGNCGDEQQRLLNSSHPVQTSHMSTAHLRLYPIPASDLVTVEFGIAPLEGYWQVTDLNGRVLRSNHKGLHDPATVFSVSEFPLGTYIFQFRASDGTLTAHRFSVLR